MAQPLFPNVRSPSETRWDLLSLGEVMLRFDPGDNRIARTRHFRVWEGGGEYNVARGLRRCFNLRTTIVTSLVDNPIGRLIEDLMFEGGVDLSHLRWTPHDGVGRHARNGTYFLERGFGVRGALGMMDRGHTPISQLQPDTIDWDSIFGTEGVRCFHTGGIFCALSEAAPAVALEAMQAAKRHGTLVSYDCNYRQSLWNDRGGRGAAIDVNRTLLPFVDILLGHEGDLDLTVGETTHQMPWHDEASYLAAANRITAQFPNLRLLATTLRRVHSAGRNDWGGLAYAGGNVFRAPQFLDLHILDRVGSGDAFAAGILFGLLAARDLPWSLACGVAHGALTMSTQGDSSMATLAEVERLIAGATATVQR